MDAQESSRGIIVGGCEACDNQYFTEYGTWAHRFQADGSIGQIEDSDCNSGPNPDVNTCHEEWWDQTCSYRHTMCYPIGLAANELSAATRSGNVAEVSAVLAKYTQISRREGALGFEMRSCDDGYKVLIAQDGSVDVLLSSVDSSGE